MSWDFAPAFDAAHQAVLQSGKPLVYVCAPAAWAVAYLFDELPPARTEGLETLVLVPGSGAAIDVANALRRCGNRPGTHPLTGLGRTERLLRADAVGTLVATPADAHYLLRRAALKSGGGGEKGLRHVAILWPEAMTLAGAGDDLDVVMGDTQEAQRLVVTADEATSAGFLERYARRAPVAVHSRIPERPLARGTVRYAAVGQSVRVPTARAALDILAPLRTLVWDPVQPDRWGELTIYPDVALAGGPESDPADLLIAADLPSAEALAALSQLADEILVLLQAYQVPYLKRIVATARPLRLPGYADRVRTEATTLREDLRQRLESGDNTAGLLAVESLLDKYDPIQLAAAALTTPATAADEPRKVTSSNTDSATWTRLLLTAGRRDRVQAGDILKTLLRSAKIARSDVGRIDLKETFSLVEVRPEVAEDVVRRVTGEQIRGRRVTARLDRHEAPGGGSRAR